LNLRVADVLVLQQEELAALTLLESMIQADPRDIRALALLSRIHLQVCDRSI